MLAISRCVVSKEPAVQAQCIRHHATSSKGCAGNVLALSSANWLGRGIKCICDSIHYRLIFCRPSLQTLHTVIDISKLLVQIRVAILWHPFIRSTDGMLNITTPGLFTLTLTHWRRAADVQCVDARPLTLCREWRQMSKNACCYTLEAGLEPVRLLSGSLFLRDSILLATG